MSNPPYAHLAGRSGTLENTTTTRRQERAREPASPAQLGRADRNERKHQGGFPGLLKFISGQFFLIAASPPAKKTLKFADGEQISLKIACALHDEPDAARKDETRRPKAAKRNESEQRRV